MVFIADFETINNENDCRVWLWGLYNIDSKKFFYGDTIESFFEKIMSLKNKSKIYFHNLKFDGEFLFYFFFRNGFQYTFGKLQDKTFKTIISHLSHFYMIEFCIGKKTFKFLDSLKIVPLKVSEISKAFGIEELKGKIDYNKERPIGYKPDENEIEYLKNDVIIVSKAVEYFYSQKLKKITASSNALNDFKKIISIKNFERWFVLSLEQDNFIRRSYKGGFTYVNPKFQNNIIENGLVYDVNSLYPAIMYNEKLPYGEPLYFEGKYKPIQFYELFVQRFICNFKLKENHIPTLQIKNNIFFCSQEYLTSSNNIDVELVLTSVDMDLFFKHYDVYNVEFIDGYAFKASTKVFKSYINKWNEIKVKAQQENNKGLRTIAKLMLNSLYGKFASNPEIKSKYPVYHKDEDFITYELTDKEFKNPLYVAIASFVTSYGRKITIESAQKNFHRFLYADTDSIHLKGLEEPTNIKIDKEKLGYWKLEGKFTKAKFLRAKCYIEEIEGKLKVTVAGLPEETHKNVNFENFNIGLNVENKLSQKRVSGGIVLKNIEYTIKM